MFAMEGVLVHCELGVFIEDSLKSTAQSQICLRSQRLRPESGTTGLGVATVDTFVRQSVERLAYTVVHGSLAAEDQLGIQLYLHRGRRSIKRSSGGKSQSMLVIWSTVTTNRLFRLSPTQHNPTFHLPSKVCTINIVETFYSNVWCPVLVIPGNFESINRHCFLLAWWLCKEVLKACCGSVHVAYLPLREQIEIEIFWLDFKFLELLHGATGIVVSHVGVDLVNRFDPAEFVKFRIIRHFSPVIMMRHLAKAMRRKI